MAEAVDAGAGIERLEFPGKPHGTSAGGTAALPDFEDGGNRGNAGRTTGKLVGAVGDSRGVEVEDSRGLQDNDMELPSGGRSLWTSEISSGAKEAEGVGNRGRAGFSESGEALEPGDGGSQERAQETAQVVENRPESNEAAALVAEIRTKAPCIVKSEFLTPAVVRMPARIGAVTGTGTGTGTGSTLRDEKTGDLVVPDKKSKRQLRREKQLAKKSTEGVCSVVARTGDVSQCIYGENCQYNHDLQGYLDQKPPDLPGKCPSLDRGLTCSYGVACRFAGTHIDSSEHGRIQEWRPNAAADERNGLSKERQRLLWKNNGFYPKAEATLQAMGLWNKSHKFKTMKEADQVPARKSVREEPGAKEIIEDSALGSNDSLPNARGYPETTGSEVDVCEVPDSLHRGEEHEEKCPPADVDMIGGDHGPQKRLRIDSGKANADTLESTNGTHSRDDNEGVVGHISNNVGDDDDNTSGPKLPSPEDSATKDNIGLCSRGDGWQSLYNESKLGQREKKIIDFRDKLYLAPLTTVGNLPFRRVCKSLGADITCGEMAMCINLLQGQASEWALLRRHSSEDLFGVQICGPFPDHVARTAELIEQECEVDFIDVNMGCPIDLVVNKGAGSCLLTKPQRLEHLVRATAAVMENPLTIKVRVGYYEGRNCAHTLIPKLDEWGVNAVTIHGRTRQQRYSKVADWAYIQQCASLAKGNLQVIGNGDAFSYTDWTEHLKSSGSQLSTCMIARGALVKPWFFQEIKEGRHWDISSGERLDILRQYVRCGLEHWGSDSKGVETTRHFLLEWLSYMHRYIPVGLLEVIPQRLNWRPPSYFGRNDLETMMSSDNATDWVKITELLLGRTPANFSFTPKHKSNSYDRPENG